MKFEKADDDFSDVIGAPEEFGTRDHAVAHLAVAAEARGVRDTDAMALHLAVAVVSALCGIGDDIEGLWKGER